jgi:hypothetical protein
MWYTGITNEGKGSFTMNNSTRAIGFVVCILLALAGVYAVYAAFNAQTAQIDHLKAQVTQGQNQNCQKAAHEWQESSVADNGALNALLHNEYPTVDDYNKAATYIKESTKHINSAKSYNCPGAEGVDK